MEYKFTVSYPLALLSPSDKSQTQKASMENLLTNFAYARPLNEWLHDVALISVNALYVVTHATHYKRRCRGYQHEYLVFVIEPPPNQPGGGQRLLEVSRTIANNGYTARLGLFGQARDTARIHPAGTQINDRAVDTLVWTLNNGPRLDQVTRIVASVSDGMPHYSLLRTSCYMLARAAMEAILAIHGGRPVNAPLCLLTRQSYYLGCIPAGRTEAQKVARLVVQTLRVYQQLPDIS